MDFTSRRPVLRSNDPLRCCLESHLAAQAPAMKSALEALLRKLHNAGWVEDGDYRRGRIVQFARAVFADTTPDYADLAPLIRSGALEFDLAAARRREVG